MAVRIRLSRVGRRNDPYFRIAVYDGRTRRDGEYLEQLGTYNPRAKPEQKVRIDKVRYDHWVSKGALPTEALERILKHVQVIPKEG